MSTSSVDLVIVGAGAAGLAAARTARELGLDFALVEALPRIGGRAYTDVETFGVPWDVGCHWLHSANINPFTGLADAYGFRYRKPAPWRVHLGDRWASDEEDAAIDDFIDESVDAIAAEGKAGRDVAVGEVVDRESRWIHPFTAVINAEWGSSLDDVSTVDYVNYRDTEENWPLQDGYGALVACHAQGIPVSLSTVVERIDWGSKRVRVTTSQGTLDAGAVIVTVSTGVLAAEVIRFEPALPDWKQAAIAAVPLGKANKIAFQLDGGVPGIERHTNMLAPLASGSMMGFQLNPFETNLASAYVGGQVCSDLERAGEAAMFEAALTALTAVFGSEIRRRVVKTICSRWESEPFIRGAYAAAQPGQAHRRADLARPLDDRLFFAGEATSPDFFSTCHGAHLTGIAAARAAAVALGRGAV